ncbi:DNA repair protein XRCC4 [Neolamprologus brichardi]|uniref:DNA repair protein XRCC4 n=1 Tax=Neolamprologus brichardi TaxID=32507 RepID=UPI001643F53F|nr:DNA repair protein XRCC4 [Neolamprologus brichardi]
MHTSVREINLSSDTSYFLRVDWEGCNFSTGFQLLLTDGQDAWRGEVLSFQRLKINFKGLKSFEINVAWDIGNWLGYVLLNAVPDPAEAVRSLLIYSLQRGNNLQHHNQRLQEENERLRGEQQHITADWCKVLFRLAHWLRRRWCPYCTKIIISIVRLLSFCLTTVFHSPDSMLFSESPTPGPLDESLSDLTDVAPSRKRRFRHLRAPEAAVKRPNPETSQRKRNDSPAGSSKHQTPRLSADVAAASSAVEDLFEEF